MKQLRTLALWLCLLVAVPTSFGAPSSAPQNLLHAWLGTESILLWDEVPGATAYKVYRADDGTTWTPIATGVASTTWRDDTLQVFPSYYVVTAINADGEGPGSEIATLQGGEGGSVLTIYDPQVWEGTLTPTNAIVRWAVSNVDGDQGVLEWAVAESNATHFPFLLVNTNYLGMHAFQLTNLTPRTIYNYRVTSIDQQRLGTSVVRSFATPDTNHPPAVNFILQHFPDPDGPRTILFWAVDPDFPPQNITFSFTAPTNGTLGDYHARWSSDIGDHFGTFYQPSPGARGLDAFSITASDGFASGSATIVISNWSNRLPEAGHRVVNIFEDTPTLISVPSVDPNGDPVTFNVTSAYGGSVSGTGPDFLFTPELNAQSGGFFYEVSDPYGTNNGFVEIQMTPVNDPPVAWSAVRHAWEDLPCFVSFEFSDLEGGEFDVIVTRPPTNGVLTGDGFSRWYTPAPNYHGFDSLEFVIAEPDGTTSAVATISITIFPGLDAPLVPAQTVEAQSDVPVTFSLEASDPDGDALSFSLVNGPSRGTLSGELPNLTYIPAPGFTGFDTFTYSTSDGVFVTEGMVTIHVGLSDLPQVSGLRRRVYDTDGVVRLWWNSVPGALHYNVYRADGSNAPFTLLASNVTATNFHDATAAWQQPYFYRVRSWGGTNEGRLSPPVFVKREGTGMLTLDMWNWSVRGTRANPGFITSLAEGAEGMFEYGLTRDYGTTIENTNILPGHRFFLSNLTPGTRYYFRITATDRFGNATTTAGFYQDYFTTEAPPVAHAQALSTSEDERVHLTLSGTMNTYFPVPHRFHLITPPAHGTLTLQYGDTDYRYQPATNFFGTDSFTFVVRNDELESAPATVSITVQPVNDGPEATNSSVVIAEDTLWPIPLNATDVEGQPITFDRWDIPTNGTVVRVEGSVAWYLPGTNFVGTDAFSYRAHDGINYGNLAWVFITVTNREDAPTGFNQTVSTPEDTPKSIHLTAGDPDGDAVTLSIHTLPNVGTLTGTPPNVTYRPPANFHGTAQFTFRAHDGKSYGPPATVTINVTPVNDAPFASNVFAIVLEDTSATIPVMVRDVDAGSTLTVELVQLPTNGVVIEMTGTNFVYQPNTNYAGADSFTYRAWDGVAFSSPATVFINVTPVNDAPLASGQSLSTTEDAPLAASLAGQDVDGDALTFTVVNGPAHGALSGTPPNLTYTPSANFHGSDSFEFAVADGSLSATAAVSIAIAAVNDLPVAQSIERSVNEDESLALALVANDVDGDALTIRVLDAPTNGTLSGSAPNLTYTPHANFHGADSFTFTANDGVADGIVAVVTLTVAPVNDSPTAVSQTLNTAEDTTLAVGLLGSDVDGDALAFEIVSGPTNGTLSGTAPELTYSPQVNFHGSDAVVFRVSDGFLTSTGVISISVTAVNDAPVAQGGGVTLNEDSSANIVLRANEPDGDALAFTILAPPSHGTLSGTAPNLTYTPAPNFHGTDTLTFRVSDGSIESSTATVTFTVTPVNDAPVASPQSVSVTYNTARSITLTGSDVEGSALTYTIVMLPTNGTFSGAAPNVVYTPNVGSAGADRFTFQVNDGAAASASATVTLTTQNPSGAPAAPTSLVVTVPSTRGQLVLSWNDNSSNEDGFRIERSNNGSSGWTAIATNAMNARSFTNSGLTSNTRYYYRVRSFNRLGNSAYSNTANGRTR
jgi:fibronectin type 3 domain-containing protein